MSDNTISKAHVSTVSVMVDLAETKTLEYSADSIPTKIYTLTKNILTVKKMTKSNMGFVQFATHFSEGKM